MDWLPLVAIALGSILPSLAYAGSVRRMERYNRESASSVFVSLFYGATLGVILGLIFSLVFDTGFLLLDPTLAASGALFGAVIIAPIAEELAKGLGLGLRKKRMWELEDGIVYGAAIGFGFAATENILYGVTALAEGGVYSAAITVFIRAISSTLLHGSTTALLGLGYVQAIHKGNSILTVVPVYLLAAVIHGGYNFLVSRQSILAFLFAVLAVSVIFSKLKSRVEDLDKLPHTEL